MNYEGWGMDQTRYTKNGINYLRRTEDEVVFRHGNLILGLNCLRSLRLLLDHRDHMGQIVYDIEFTLVGHNLLGDSITLKRFEAMKIILEATKDRKETWNCANL